MRVGIGTLDVFFSHRTLRFSAEQGFSGFVLFNASLTKNTGTDSVCTAFHKYYRFRNRRKMLIDYWPRTETISDVVSLETGGNTVFQLP